MSKDDIERLRKNELCVVVAANPATVKFVDPIPAASSRTKIEDAAITLSRRILTPGFLSNHQSRENLTAMFVDILVHGTPLDPAPSQAEMEKQIFDSAKADELRRLAKEEAKAERAAAKTKTKTHDQETSPH